MIWVIVGLVITILLIVALSIGALSFVLARYNELMDNIERDEIVQKSIAEDEKKNNNFS